jgi:hypothetical protein
VEAVSKRSRQKKVRGKRAKSPKVKNSSQSPNTIVVEDRTITPVSSTEHSLWVEKPKAYLVILYEAVLELSFVSILLSIHTVYHVYGIDLLPESPLKKVGLALVSLLGILRILQVVKSSVEEFRGDAGKKKRE